ncbi:beta-mannosidase [Paenibacillus phyllosphaerae]|uniref:Beta-mannosidase n=1 Tax=Paenibacillus phyllosphaerae TaxID=274593 RepID=A0A7W5B2A8_9BACL|nr:glycoside hydrolase family 2 protein [Paenibacillus phyllosphaerae]MBB3112546.1 beta-mannosidase [Paenibacillus phyllosphaerae]
MSELNLKLDAWTFKACDEQEWLPAQVPGCVHTDLLKNDRIPNPFYGTNERLVQWIDKKDWEYTAAFDVPQELFAQSRLELVFDGLDTYADVSINGTRVISADNMFRTWKADVKDLLKCEGNVAHIRFRSPIQQDLPKLEQLGYALPASNDQSDVGELGDKKVSIFARKAPYHYGWDWGPRFVTSGIWREVRLEGWSDTRITDIYIRQDNITAANANFTAIVEIESETAWEGTLRLAADGYAWEREVKLSAGANKVELQADLANPKLWWSRGLGDAHLYSFEASLAEGETVRASKSIRTGLRSIRVVREKDAHGTSFYFEVNGVPVFAKGANHIPNDSFLTEITYARYRHEIATAAESNMNMLRVWGGGIYEDRMFYELCDEYGMLVWQDFMFACSMYPGDEAFLENVRLEAEENVKRLRNHPSVALWCGNNEIDIAWGNYDENIGWGWKQLYTPEQREKMWADYEAIFHRILPEAVNKMIAGTDYWPSSPMQALTGDASQHATNSSTSGDIHYWGVWHAVEPLENYNVHIGRFMSEYGFQSFPEYKTVREYAEESDLALESEVMLAHQKNGRGNSLIKEYMDMYLPEPKDFPSFLYMSQLLQADAMRSAIEAHRRRKDFCMGTLYWQMNDCWPVASWAGVDYYGRWKAMQYHAKRSFKDVSLSIDGTSGTHVNFHVITDLLAPISGTIDVQVLTFSGEVLKTVAIAAEAAANSAQQVASLTVEELLEGREPGSVLLQAVLKQGGEELDRKEHYFVPAKDIKLAAPTIRITEVAGSGGTQFTLTTDVLAKQVWIASEAEGIFSDNFFDLVPGVPVTVGFQARQDGAAAFAPASPGTIEVRSMADFINSLVNA